MSESAQVTVLNDRYQLGEVLGRGGMGVVYRAHDPTLERDVAVKMLSELSLGTQGRERLLDEAKAIAKLSHPNIVAVHDAGETGETPFIVMEMIEGTSLYERPPEDLSGIVEVAKQVCAALDHAHDQGIVHRDLKPENVLIDGEGTAKLMDFGIARSMTSRLTSGGEIIGTVFYLAPEIGLGHEYDGRADLYSLGVMLYELPTGALPFADGDPVSVISQHIHTSVVPPRANNPEIPPLLDALIVQLMSKDPDGRPSSAAATRQLLERDDLLDPEAKGERELLVLERIVRGRFVGRDHELSEARSLWSKAESGEGQTLLISGEPGIGKTRLMRELSTHVEVTGGRTLIGFCYEEGGAPYAPFAQILRKALRASSENGFHLPDFVLADLLGLAPELKPYYPDVPPNPALEPDAEQQRLFENMVAFCNEVSQTAPLMMVLDDVHWADSGSLSLMRHLARRIRHKPVLLLATYREVELDAARPFREVMLALNRERLARRMKLNRLSTEQTSALLEVIFQEDISQEFLDGIYHETEGNPFFIEEVCKALIEEGQVFHTAKGWDRLDMDEMEIPQSVRDVVQARAAKLPQPFQDTLTLAAVLGREFDFDTLVEASDLDENTLIEALEAAEDSQLIQEVSGEGGATFSFVHALIPSTLVESVRTLRRRILHQRAAAAIESLNPGDYESLAQHYEEAGRDEKARGFYAKAGRRAASAYANQEAERHFRAALDLGPSEMKHAELLSELAAVIDRVGRHEEAITSWKAASDIFGKFGHPEQVAKFYASMGRAKWLSGDGIAAQELSKQGLELVQDAPDSADKAHLLNSTARAHFFGGNIKQAESMCRQALKMARSVSAKRVEADALITLGMLPTVSMKDSLSSFEQAIAICQAEEYLALEGRAQNNMGVTYDAKGANFRRGLEHYRAAGEIGARMGDKVGELFSLSNAAWSEVILGELTTARKSIAYLKDLLEELPESEASRRVYQDSVAQFEHAMGNTKEASELRGELFRDSLESGSPLNISIESRYFGLALIETGHLSEASRALQRGVEAADEIGENRVLTRAVLVQILARSGHVDRARRAYDEAEEIHHERSYPRSEMRLRMADADLATAEQRWDEMPAAFERAAQALERAEARLWRAGLLCDWANAHIQRSHAGDLARAVDLRKEALSEYEAMGSLGYAKQTQSRIRELEDISQ
jgi:tetratricopeptide (TPR) repeat protein